MNDKPKIGDLRVWWVPRMPMNAFYWPVKTPMEGKSLLVTLAEYDLFQLRNNIKPDFCNAGGMEVFDGSEWSEWSDDEGNCVEDLVMLEDQ